MSMMMRIAGRVRGLYPFNSAENREDEQVAINNRGDMSVVQGLPELTELVRLGDSWQVALTTGIAALTALPTTVAGLTLWNGEPANGKCYAIDSFGTWEAVTDATQNDSAVVFAMNNRTPVAAPVNASIAIGSMSGRTYGGKARTVSGGTVTNDGWYPHAGVSTPVTVFAGTLWRVNEVQVRGLYLVPPGGAFNTQIVKSVAAAAAQQFHFIRWHEVVVIYKT